MWERCLDIVRVNVPAQDYDAWFAPLAFESLDAEAKTIVLRAPSHAICEALEQEKRLRHLLYNIVWRTFGDELTITYRILVDSTTNQTSDIQGTRGTTALEHINRRTKKVTPNPESELNSQLNENYTFENFIEGEGNKLLRSVGLSIAQNPKQNTFNPLFVYGSSGVGKTHLVNAIGIQFKRNAPQSRVLYLTANTFKVQFMTARQENHINDFIYFYQTIDVLIIDDIQEFAGLEGTQATFFHIFNHLKMNGKHIILTADRPPQSMPGMEERLLTRFKWGLAAEITKPDYQLCRNILASRVKLDGLDIPDDVLDYIALNATGSIRDLEGALSSLMAHALVYNRDIDQATAREVVAKTMRPQRRTVTIELITATVCQALGASEEQVQARGRKEPAARARQLIMHLAMKHTTMPASRIGFMLGGRSHATVLHAAKHVKQQLQSDPAFASKVREIEASIL